MSIITEILHGTWLLETNDPTAYKKLADAILSGTKIPDPKPESFQVIGKTEYASDGKAVLTDQVSVIGMIGEMTKRSGLCNYGVDHVCNEFLKADRNPEVKGHIFLADGPGGNADAMPLILDLKTKLTKPVIALVERACSLHYWAVCELADHIMMANNLTAEVGSVGAMIMFEKPTNEIIMVRPKQSSMKNEGFRQALEGDTSLLEAKLEPLAIAFQNGVKANRPKVKEESLLGETYYSAEAIERGLADSIGDINKAYELVLMHAELKQFNNHNKK